MVKNMQKNYLLNVQTVKVIETGIVSHNRSISVHKFINSCKKNIKKFFSAWVVEKTVVIRPARSEIIKDLYFNATSEGLVVVPKPEVGDSVYIAFSTQIGEDRILENKEFITVRGIDIDLVQSVKTLEIAIAKKTQKKS